MPMCHWQDPAEIVRVFKMHPACGSAGSVQSQLGLIIQENQKHQVKENLKDQ